MAYRWLLFDADGTLFDFDRAQEEALRECWAAAGLASADDLVSLFRSINGELWGLYERGETTQERLRVERFERLLAATAAEGAADDLALGFVDRLARQGTLYDGAAELLTRLAERHVLALVTNGIPEVQRSRIRHSGIEELFSAIVISGEVGVAKPDARFFDAAFESLGHPPRRDVLLIGDSLSSDIEGGRGYGIATCWLNPGGAPAPDGAEPTHQVRRLAELPGLLARAAGGSAPR
jgi:2-haloacid dehalogenase